MYTVIGVDGQEYGPVDVATIQTWIQAGRVLPSSMIIDPIDNYKKPASSIPELARYFPPGGAFSPPAAPQGYFPSQPYHQPMGVYVGPPKSKLTAVLLALFLGFFGIHRFYLGHTNTGIAMIIMALFGWVFLGIPYVVLFVWQIVDIIMILTGSLLDGQGRPLTN